MNVHQQLGFVPNRVVLANLLQPQHFHPCWNPLDAGQFHALSVVPVVVVVAHENAVDPTGIGRWQKMRTKLKKVKGT